MNICFFSGIIDNKPDFKFIVSKNLNFKDSLHISVTKFDLMIDEDTRIFIKAYDEGLFDKLYTTNLTFIPKE